MNIVVLGASGMIGLYLVDDLLKKNHHITAVGRNEKWRPYFEKRGITYILADVSKPKDLLKLPSKNVDVVVNSAAVMPAVMKGYQPEEYIKVNTLGMLHILEYCTQINVKQIIYMQSHSDLGGYWGQQQPIDPYSTYSILYGNDHSVYIISKIAALELIKHYHAQTGISYAVFRCPNIYAWHPNQYYYVNGKPQEVAYRKLIRQAMASEPLEIWGNSQTKKDIVYVKDLTQMVCSAIERQIKAGIYNVATGKSTSLEEQIKGIIEVFSPKNKPSALIYRPDKKVHLNNHHYDISNAVKDLGYEPQYPYLKMLEDMKLEIQEDRFKECM